MEENYLFLVHSELTMNSKLGRRRNKRASTNYPENGLKMISTANLPRKHFSQAEDVPLASFQNLTPLALVPRFYCCKFHLEN